MVALFLCLSLSLFSTLRSQLLSLFLSLTLTPRWQKRWLFPPVALSRLITITTPAGSIFWFDTLGNREQQLTAVIHCSLHCSLVT